MPAEIPTANRQMHPARPHSAPEPPLTGALRRSGLCSARFADLVGRMSSADEWFDVVNARDEVVRRATRRELGEEIGVEPAAGEAPVRWFRLEACAATGWEFLWVYHLRHDGPITVNPEEIQYGE